MLSPTDAAWSVLEEGHRVEKFIPAALVGVAAAQGLRNAGFRFRDEEGNLAPGFRGSATVADPTGLASKEIEDPSTGERFLAVGTQLVPVGAGIGVARRAGSAVRAGRATRSARAADQAGDTARISADRARRAGPHLDRSPATAGRRDELYSRAESDAMRARKLRRTANKRALPTTSATAKRSRVPGLLTGAGIAYAGQKIGQGLQNLINPNAALSQGFGAGGGMAPAQSGQQGFQLANQPSGGVGGVQNVGVSGMADHDIFQGKQFQSAPTSSNMQGPSIKQKGTPMSLGNNLINSTLGVMERNIMKASVCERCGKKGCVNKMHCMAKADDGKKKKPAHGMVIVIGSKAGPGPSTNGKRDDKKDDKE